MTSHVQDTQRKQLLARLRDAVLRAGLSNSTRVTTADLDAVIELASLAVDGSPTEVEALRRVSGLEAQIEDLKGERDDNEDRAVRAEDALAEARSQIRSLGGVA